MRGLLPPFLVVGLLLSGCLGEEPEETVDEEDDGDSRRSIGGGGTGGNNTDPPHVKLTLLDTVVDLVAGQPVEFDVSVPDNVTNIDFAISVSDLATPVSTVGGVAVFQAFRIELEGCGVYDQGMGISGGTIHLDGRLCKDASGGTVKLTASNNGALKDGQLRLVGHLPKDNATAPA